MIRLPGVATLLAALFIAAGAILVSPAPAVAADPARNPFDFGGQEGVWSSQCEVDRMTDFRACRVVSYRLFDDGQTQGFIALSVIPTGNDYHLFVTTNMGQVQNCAIRVDRQPRIETHIATFGMCMFPNFQSGRTVEQFKGGTAVLLRISYARGGGRRDMDFPLNGFSKAFDEMQRLVQ